MPLGTVVKGVVNHEVPDSEHQTPPSDSAPIISFEDGLLYYSSITDNEQPLTDSRDDSKYADRKYYPGFNVQATISVLSRKARIRAQIFTDRSGFDLAGALKDPIDLGIIKLSRRDDSEKAYGDGPNVKYVWNKRSPDDPHKIGVVSASRCSRSACETSLTPLDAF